MFEQLSEELEREGQLVDHGCFTLDEASAWIKLSNSQVPEFTEVVLLVRRALIGLGAKQIDIVVGSGKLVVAAQSLDRQPDNSWLSDTVRTALLQTEQPERFLAMARLAHELFAANSLWVSNPEGCKNLIGQAEQQSLHAGYAWEARWEIDDLPNFNFQEFAVRVRQSSVPTQLSLDDVSIPKNSFINALFRPFVDPPAKQTQVIQEFETWSASPVWPISLDRAMLQRLQTSTILSRILGCLADLALPLKSDPSEKIQTLPRSWRNCVWQLPEAIEPPDSWIERKSKKLTPKLITVGVTNKVVNSQDEQPAPLKVKGRGGKFQDPPSVLRPFTLPAGGSLRVLVPPACAEGCEVSRHRPADAKYEAWDEALGGLIEIIQGGQLIARLSVPNLPGLWIVYPANDLNTSGAGDRVVQDSTFDAWFFRLVQDIYKTLVEAANSLENSQQPGQAGLICLKDGPKGIAGNLLSSFRLPVALAGGGTIGAAAGLLAGVAGLGIAAIPAGFVAVAAAACTNEIDQIQNGNATQKQCSQLKLDIVLYLRQIAEVVKAYNSQAFAMKASA